MKHIWTCAIIFTAAFFSSCGDAILPSLARNIHGEGSGTAGLGEGYEYKPYSPTYPGVPLPGYSLSIPVNPKGLGVRAAYYGSDGIIYVDLAGQVDSGIPDGLHAILDKNSLYPSPGTFKYTYPTDYPIYPIFTDSIYPTPPNASAILPMVAKTYSDIDEQPIEEMIALSSLYDNPKYTAVTIRGIVAQKSAVELREENDSFTLLTSSYVNGYNANSSIYDIRRRPAYKNLIYWYNPNIFSYGGYAPEFNQDYRGGGKGGYNILVWDGAKTKSGSRARLRMSYDSGKRWEIAVVDWSAVTFKDVPLQYMAWYQNPYYVPGATMSNYTATSRADYADLNDFSVDIEMSSRNEAQDGFLTPTFYPANSTGKQVYLTSDNMEPGLSPYMPSVKVKKLHFGPDPTGIVTDPVVVATHEESYFTVEIADRIKVTPNPSIVVAPSTSYEAPVYVFCDTYPPVAPGIDGPIKATIILELNVKVNF